MAKSCELRSVTQSAHADAPRSPALTAGDSSTRPECLARISYASLARLLRGSACDCVSSNLPDDAEVRYVGRDMIARDGFVVVLASSQFEPVHTHGELPEIVITHTRTGDTHADEEGSP